MGTTPTANSHSNSMFTFLFFILLLLFNSAIIRSTLAAYDLNIDKEIEDKLKNDPESKRIASMDYGHIITKIPLAILNPTSVKDIENMVRYSYTKVPIHLAARGQAHSVHGQAQVPNGIVVNMTTLGIGSNNSSSRIVITESSPMGPYADVGAEQLWIDVLHASLEKGLSPVSWTDYLYLTVGGTLSNAGISGQTFRVGPQINHVHELDVVTGKQGFMTCSAKINPELFFGVLGGLGQFGIITRARIALAPAPTRAKWVRMLYTDFSLFTKDQEFLITNNGLEKSNALNYIEGLLFFDIATSDNTSFFPLADQPRIASLIATHGIVYTLEVVKYYDQQSAATIDQDLESLLQGLSYESGFKFVKDTSYEEFLDRVHKDQLTLESLGLWEVPHPWLNLFIPKSRVTDFNDGVFRGILLKNNITSAHGVFIFYPMLKSKWDERMSAVIPDEEEIFYTVGFLFSSGFNEWQKYAGYTNDILKFCADSGIKIKHYLPNHEENQDWIDHFGPKWPTFLQNKINFDPFHVFAPGQSIFN